MILRILRNYGVRLGQSIVCGIFSQIVGFPLTTFRLLFHPIGVIAAPLGLILLTGYNICAMLIWPLFGLCADIDNWKRGKIVVDERGDNTPWFNEIMRMGFITF